MWPTITMGTPAAIARSNGTSSSWRSWSSVLSVVMASVSLSPCAPPMPGKCFAQHMMPPSRKPFTADSTMGATASAVVPNERFAMVWLVPFTMSASGAKSRLKPNGTR